MGLAYHREVRQTWLVFLAVLVAACERPVTSPDASTDAAVPDAGLTSDGGVGGGALDGGTGGFDGGGLDGGGLDGGAGGLDGGASDGGELDGGALDGGPLLSFVEVSANGYYTSCALTDAGLPFCWGLGQPDGLVYRIPTAVPVGDAGPFVSLSTGGIHSCALDATGQAWCWGQGPLGDVDGPPWMVGSSASPVLVAGGLAFSQLSASQDYSRRTCAVADGGAWCWGSVLGAPTTVPTLVPSSAAFVAVSCGEWQNCALDGTGAAFCWGEGFDGELGTGDPSIWSTTTPVPVVGGHAFRSISAGVSHTCAVTMTGDGYCWGRSVGPFADGGFGRSDAPVLIAGGHSFAVISAGTDISCGVMVDGGLVCWGAYPGPGSFPGSLTPVMLDDGGRAFTSVSAGTGHACGRDVNGIVFCWGDNGSGALGDGTATASFVPVRVAGQR